MEIKQTIDAKELRSFGFVMGGMIALFFGLLIPWIWDLDFPWWPWIVAALFAVVAAIAPLPLKPVYRIWLNIGAVLGWINTRIILSLIFFVIMLPIGLIMRLFTDPMRRRLHTADRTYRVDSHQPKPENFKRPF